MLVDGFSKLHMYRSVWLLSLYVHNIMTHTVIFIKHKHIFGDGCQIKEAPYGMWIADILDAFKTCLWLLNVCLFVRFV